MAGWGHAPRLFPLDVRDRRDAGPTGWAARPVRGPGRQAPANAPGSGRPRGLTRRLAGGKPAVEGAASVGGQAVDGMVVGIFIVRDCCCCLKSSESGAGLETQNSCPEETAWAAR